MYQKFESLPEEKRQRIINAALREFSVRAFKNASTEKIAAAAEISKGALFEYFRTKKQLYAYLLDYAMKELLEKYGGFWSHAGSDPLEIVRGLFTLKMEQMKEYPALYDFLARAYMREPDPELSDMTRDRAEAAKGGFMKNAFDKLDYSLFKDGFDPRMLMNVVIWTLYGYSDSEMAKLRASGADFHDTGEWEKTIAEYFRIFRVCLYK